MNKKFQTVKKLFGHKFSKFKMFFKGNHPLVKVGGGGKTVSVIAH